MLATEIRHKPIAIYNGSDYHVGGSKKANGFKRFEHAITQAISDNDKGLDVLANIFAGDTVDRKGGIHIPYVVNKISELSKNGILPIFLWGNDEACLPPAQQRSLRTGLVKAGATIFDNYKRDGSVSNVVTLYDAQKNPAAVVVGAPFTLSRRQHMRYRDQGEKTYMRKYLETVQNVYLPGLKRDLIKAQEIASENNISIYFTSHVPLFRDAYTTRLVNTGLEALLKRFPEVVAGTWGHVEDGPSRIHLEGTKPFVRVADKIIKFVEKTRSLMPNSQKHEKGQR